MLDRFPDSAGDPGVELRPAVRPPTFVKIDLRWSVTVCPMMPRARAVPRGSVPATRCRTMSVSRTVSPGDRQYAAARRWTASGCAGRGPGTTAAGGTGRRLAVVPGRECHRHCATQAERQVGQHGPRCLLLSLGAGALPGFRDVGGPAALPAVGAWSLSASARRRPGVRRDHPRLRRGRTGGGVPEPPDDDRVDGPRRVARAGRLPADRDPAAAVVISSRRRS